MKIGLLLLNTGTPDHFNPSAVKRYLKSFLSDPRVIDIHPIARWLLLHLFILPFRPKKSAAAYQKIWLKEGSPLRHEMEQFKQTLATKLGSDYVVALGMRYGQPSIEGALHILESCTQIIIFPLFPQYAAASTGSVLEKSLSLLSRQWNIPALKVIREFYDHAGFIQAYAAIIQNALSAHSIDMLVFSYHGIPMRHIKKSQCQIQCVGETPCPAMCTQNKDCYRAQCYATSEAIARTLQLSKSQYTVAFQSRLGRTPWIKPYTDLVLPELIQKNVRRIAVVCPSFVADCLETLEEVGIRMKVQWEHLGGEFFITIPCLNANPAWVEAAQALIESLR